MKTRFFAGMVIVGLCFSGMSSLEAAVPLVLVENGESRMPIVIFENAPPMTRRAADELAEYIEKVSGARPAVIEGTPDPLPAQAVWVGMQPVLAELFPGLDLKFQHPEEILLAANRNHLVIAGRDRWNPDHLTVEFPGPGRRTMVVEGVQQEYGTCNAVYTFLQDYLGIRWLWPGELGEDVPRKDTIAFAPFEYRYHPQFRSRSGIFRLADLFSWRGITHEWSRLQRLQLDSLTLVTGHPFSGWW
ncbi:MAG: hypothetical protein LC725_12000, partial [Lentisphaerae bacterium]|nr:hypothetical protein [Lentisphaerota bacterium]